LVVTFPAQVADGIGRRIVGFSTRSFFGLVACPARGGGIVVNRLLIKEKIVGTAVAQLIAREL
jgi:hypothetical protein